MISQLSLLGSHDSCSLFGGPLVQTQSLSVADQLEAGVRVLDLRLDHFRDTLMLVHGAFDQQITFMQVLRSVCTFLETRPTEFVLMRIKKEGVPLPPHARPFGEQVLTDIISECGALFLMCKEPPSVKEAQGKIIVLQDFDGVSIGIPWRSCKIQDEFWVLSCVDSPLKAKLKAALSHAQEAAKSRENVLFINFLSGTGGCPPWTVSKFIKPAFFSKAGPSPAGITMCDFVTK